MRPGVKIKEIVVGTGEEAARGKAVIVNVRTFLHRGTELTDTSGPRMRIDLGRRECIAGLQYGIEGMRVGGRRELTISPHLAYGAEGVPGRIPPNAVIHCEVELLAVRERDEYRPEDYPSGKHLGVFHPGEAARNLPRWQFGLREDGGCGVIVTYAIPGLTWRHTRRSQAETHLDPATVRALFEEVFNLPKTFPEDCLPNADLWSDHAEPANAITRRKQDDVLCVTISVLEHGQWLCYYSMAETSRALADSQIMRTISDLIKKSSGESKV